jgi:ankyrin repeat protein
MFDDNEFLETRQFSVIHKIFLGLLGSTDLDVYLMASTAQIDDVDVSKRTPLSWAAARSDRKSVEILLSHGADIHISDRDGSFPLHCAATAQDPC